ncbi:MAG: arginine--tRNA ligase, partial [Candidatus Kapaibacterium sp.]
MMQRYIEEQLHRAASAAGLEIDGPIPFGVPKQDGQGHLSTNIAMMHAKKLGKQPRILAQEIVDGVEKSELVKSVEVAGPGFINVTFRDAVYHAMAKDLDSLGDQIGRSDAGAGRTMHIEYVSANPTGPLHAGHGRNCAVGDTLANLYSWCGYDVTREYYFNNAGNQMNMLGRSIFIRLQHARGAAYLPFAEDGSRGESLAESG